MLRTPRQKFASKGYAADWKTLINAHTDTIEEAMQCALLELCDSLPSDTQIPQQACDAHQQLAGARKFMQILSSIHEPQTEPKVIPTKGLNYEAGI